MYLTDFHRILRLPAMISDEKCTKDQFLIEKVPYQNPFSSQTPSNTLSGHQPSLINVAGSAHVTI